MEIMEVFALFTILFIMISGMLASRREKHTWNNGICRNNGLPWEYFDTDSQGGRGYRAGEAYCWQTYGHDL